MVYAVQRLPRVQALTFNFWKLRDGDRLYFEGEPVIFTRPNGFTVDVEFRGVIERFHEPQTFKNWITDVFRAPTLSIRVTT